MSALEERAEQELERDRRLVEVDVSQAMGANLPPPRFAVRPLVPRGVATLLGAHGGSGKSTLALTWCAHVAAGWSWGGFAVECGTAVFVSLEDPAPLVLYRLQRIVRTYGLHWPDVVERVRVFDGTDAEAALVTEVNDHGTRMLVPTPVMQEVEDAAEGAALVVIDNASDAFDGDENSRRQVRYFIRRLSQIAKANDGGLVLLAHIDKHAARNSSKGNSYSGSTAWHNSPRSRLALTQEEESTLIVLQQEKLNFGGKKADPVSLAWSDEGVLIPYKVAPGERQEAERQQADGDAGAILRVLELAATEGLTIPTAESGPYTAWHALRKLPELPEVYRDKPGRKRLEAALVALERRRDITREAYRKPNRHPGERWALAQEVRREAA